MEYKFFDGEIEAKTFNDEDLSFIAYASRDSIDRDSEIIEAKAWDCVNYRKNPVVLWAHDYRALPVGKSQWVKRTDDGLLFKPSFANTEEGLKIYELYKQGILRAFSVGFNPRKWYDPGEEDKKGKTPKAKRVYTDVELLEISCVSVPANADALVNIYYDVKTPEQLRRMIKGVLPANRLPEKDIAQIDELEQLSYDESYDEGDPWPIEKPYPNEHACRINPPGGYDRLRRNNCRIKHEDKCIDVIFGIKDNKSEVQAYRFNKETWESDAARTWCKDHDGTFETASSENSVDSRLAEIESKIDVLMMLIQEESDIDIRWSDELNGKSEIDNLLDEVEKELQEPDIEENINPAIHELKDDIRETLSEVYQLLGKVE